MTHTTERSFTTLAVVGAGNMGSGIAQKMATEGFDVILVDVDDARAQRGRALIIETLAQGVERRIFTADVADAIAARVRATSRFEDLADVDLVVEAVFEDMGVKQEVFARLDRVCRPDAILATNTSSFAVTDLAAATAHPERVLGLHYFYHPAKNRLVEVVSGAKTEPQAWRRAWQLQEALGKTPIASRDSYGFIVNRFFAPWLTESVRMLEEGVADLATIEEAARQAFGIGMGPFELMNVTGLPIALHTAGTLGREFGAMYGAPALLASQVASGDLWTLGGTPDPSRFDTVADRLIAMVSLVAGALVDEGVGTIEDTDIGARVGLRWRRGPFELMNHRGLDRIARLVGDLAATWRVAVPEIITRQAQGGRPFSFTFVRSDVTDGIATLTVNRPDAMNALNETVVAQFRDAFHAAVADPAVLGIVIAGSGKAFIAGADIRFFVRNIEGGTIDRIARFTRECQDLLREIETCAKPVIAKVHGLALGGGVELSLACHAIVAAPKATFAFPETGIGIYPGLGGTQRTTKRIGTGLAKWLVLSGQTLGADEALAIGLIDRVVPREEMDAAIRSIVAAGPIHQRPGMPVPASHRAIAAFFDGHDTEQLRLGTADATADPRLSKAMKRVASKAPIALQVSARLIDEGAALPIEQGLALELSHLHEIFSTKDAYEGLSSLGRKPPTFQGR